MAIIFKAVGGFDNAIDEYMYYHRSISTMIEIWYYQAILLNFSYTSFVADVDLALIMIFRRLHRELLSNTACEMKK